MAFTPSKIFVAVFWLFCGKTLAKFLGEKWGGLGYLIGFLFGIIVASIVTQVVIYFYVKLFMTFPTCRKGRCSCLGDYRSGSKGRFSGWDGGGLYLYRCRCGDMYIRDGNRFTEWHPYGGPRGTRIPFKKLSTTGEWVNDE